MDKQELYELLDIESAEEFEYFENLSDYLECGEEIEYEAIAELIKGVNKDTLAGLIDSYFEEVTDFLPDEAIDIYTLFENVRRSLVGLSRNISEDSDEVLLVDELERFRKFYTIESTVHANRNGKDEVMSICDAIYLVRIGKLNGEQYEFDFSDCQEYKIDEYVMSFGDMITLSQREDEIDEAEREIERNVLGQL